MTGFRPKNFLRARMRSARNARAYTRGEHAELAGFDVLAMIDRCRIERSKIDRRDWLALRNFLCNFFARKIFYGTKFCRLKISAC